MSETGSPGAVVLLTRLARQVYRLSTEATLGMQLKEFATLVHLRDQRCSTQQALGEAMCLDANTLVLLLNSLEAAELVMRRRDPTDRRRHLVEITQLGLVALEKAERGMESVEDEVLAGLDEGEREDLRQLLARSLEGKRDQIDTVLAAKAR